MATDSITVNCPSCDAKVTAKSASLGKKIECTRCKNRFILEKSSAVADTTKSKKGSKSPVVADDDADETASPKKKDGKKAAAKAKGGGNTKVLVGALIGVLALAGLAIGAFVIFGGADKNARTSTTTPTNSQQPVANQVPNTQPPTGTPDGNPDETNPPKNQGQPKKDPEDQNPPTTPAGTNDPGSTSVTPGGPPDVPMGLPGKGGGPRAAPSGTPAPAGPPKIKFAGSDLTNLLPGDAKTALHVRMDEVTRSATTLRMAFFSRANAELFESSFKFGYREISEVIHSYVGADRLPFVLLRTKSDLDPAWLNTLEGMGRPDTPVLKGKYLYRYVLANAFISGVEQSMNIGDLIGLPIPGIKAREVNYAIGLYDARTIVVAEKNLFERFFNDLNANGFPAYKSDYKEPSLVVPTAPAEGIGSGTAPGGGLTIAGAGAGAAPGGGLTIAGAGGDAPAGLNPAAGGGTPAQGRPPRKSITSNPTYRTIEPALKKAMNQLQDEDKEPTALAFAEMVDQRSLNSLSLKDITSAITSAAMLNILAKIRVVGFALTKLNNTRGTMTAYLDYSSESEAKKAVDENLTPMFNVLKAYYSSRFREPLSIVNGDTMPSEQNSGGMPGGPRGPGMPGGPPGGMMPGAPPGGSFPGGPAGMGGPPASGGRGGKGNDASGPLRGSPPSSENNDAQGPKSFGGGGGAPGEGGPPLGPRGGSFPGGPSGPMGGPGEGQGTASGGSNSGGNRVIYSRSDTTVTVSGEFIWTKEQFDINLAGPMLRGGAVLTGKMAMFSGEANIFTLAKREIEGKTFDDVVKKTLARDMTLPQGAVARTAGRERIVPGGSEPLPYGPEDRVSFFVPLLKSMSNRTAIYDKIDIEGQPWYGAKNLEAAETWIPELLVPDYPSNAWRANSELVADGRSVGATNFVALSGVGLDSARYDAKNPAFAKKVGLMGYDHGSKLDDVTDGLANTIFLIQVPPGLDRPWIAGGGATLVGVDEKASDPAKAFLYKRTDGTRTTTVLMADGTVRTVREGIDPNVFKAMATRAGGEKIADIDRLIPVQQPQAKKMELKASR